MDEPQWFLQLGHLTFSKSIFWSVSCTLVKLYATGMLVRQPASIFSKFLKSEIRDRETILLTSLPKLYYPVEIMYSLGN